MTIQELEQFIATYGTDIYSFCVYLTGNRPEAEELYQDTFLKTLELLDKIQKTEIRKLFTICCNSDLEKSEPENKP